MGKRDSFPTKEKLLVLEYLEKTSDIAATVGFFYPKLTGASAATRCRLVWAWRRDAAKLHAERSTVKRVIARKPAFSD